MTTRVEQSAAAITARDPGDSARPLHVCHVSLTLQTGGLERILADFARLVDRSRFELSFVAMHSVGRFADEIAADGWPVRKLNAARPWRQVRELARILRREGVDVVHTHNTYPHLYATLAARWAGIPVVVNTRHGQRANHSRRSQRQFRWTSAGVDRIVGVSRDAAQRTIEQDGVRADKVTCIWNGIDTRVFPFRGCAEAPVAISVGRLSPEKDFPTLLRAAAIVRREVPGFRLRIVGDGPLRSELEVRCREWNLQETVEFLGERTDVSALMGEAGFYVSSSVTEGISLTILEAMASGLPVVATDAGGNAEIVEQDTTGLVVPIADAERLAEAIEWMCRHVDERSAMGQAGAARVATHFEARRMVDDYQQLYLELHAAKVRPRG